MELSDQNHGTFYVFTLGLVHLGRTQVALTIRASVHILRLEKRLV